MRTLVLSVLGILLAVSNWRLIRENERLGTTAQFYGLSVIPPSEYCFPICEAKTLTGGT